MADYYPADEQGVELENPEKAIDMGEQDEDVYNEEARAKLVEDDEISPVEAAFLQGAEAQGKFGHCAVCDRVLNEDIDEIYEKQVDDQQYRFCSSVCAKKK